MKQRRVQRLTLEKPLDGFLDGKPVRIHNISLRGALVETSSQKKVGKRSTFSPWEDDPIGLEGRIRRCELTRVEDSIRSVYLVAIDYSQASLASRSRLRQFLVDLLHNEIEQWKRNAAIDGDESSESFPLFDVTDREIMAELVSAARGRKVWHRFIEGSWRSSEVDSTLQPLDGFCVTSDIEEEELELLKQSYERSDDTGRQFIRLLASLAAVERS